MTYACTLPKLYSKLNALTLLSARLLLMPLCPGLIMTSRMEHIFASGPGVQEWLVSTQPTGIWYKTIRHDGEHTPSEDDC